MRNLHLNKMDSSDRQNEKGFLVLISHGTNFNTRGGCYSITLRMNVEPGYNCNNSAVIYCHIKSSVAWICRFCEFHELFILKALFQFLELIRRFDHILNSLDFIQS